LIGEESAIIVKCWDLEQIVYKFKLFFVKRGEFELERLAGTVEVVLKEWGCLFVKGWVDKKAVVEYDEICQVVFELPFVVDKF
jgi:hypothetical protein